ncbi:MAG: tRNA (cytidine(34)-2'-O)-methyltransferase [Deltaproteobacteria bacterium]|nr:tRNA (cytidine(34)-2'-O)-methyltransferase [Deltaproteobacteria bacterium]
MPGLEPVLPPLEVVLHRPEIPPNTGNIARLCACTGSRLRLVAPLGFSLDESRLKRAGLDYWDKVHVATHQSFEEVLEEEPGRPLHLFASKGGRPLWETRFEPGARLVFGSESVGLPEELLSAHAGRVVTVPMVDGPRSLNLASTVAIALYEALRQLRGHAARRC